MNILRGLLLVITLGTLSCYCVNALYQQHNNTGSNQLDHYATLPEPLARAMALEYKGLASDFLMLKVLTYLGQKLMDKEQLTRDQWQTVYLSLKQVINLDPRFLDPYVVAETTLPFDAGMVSETNLLLEKAAEILENDYRPYFFLWYNYFYFLNDPAKAGVYLEKAARKPGAPRYFSNLAARMNLYAGKIQAAVIFLEDVLRETTDSSQQKFLSIRLEALKKIGYLEYKIVEFKKRYHKAPKSLQELIDTGLISSIPKDPYGGKFYIMEGGRVYSTSKLVLPKEENKQVKE